jgi:hypothetical protein
MHNELWLFISSLCYYMTSEPGGIYLQVVSTSRHTSQPCVSSPCLVCLDHRVKLMMDFSLLAWWYHPPSNTFGEGSTLVPLGKGKDNGRQGVWSWQEGGFLNVKACLLIKDHASMVVSKNIKLYRPLVANGGDKPSNWLRPFCLWNWQGGCAS